MYEHNAPSSSPTTTFKKMPPCRKACPAGIDIPRYIRQISQGDFDGALATIQEKIPFPAVCGYACAHPCESACSRRQYDEAVAIRLLKRAAEAHSTAKTTSINKHAPTGKKVAVVGSGPCGLTAAYYLSCLGHEVKVFEALPMAGGMLRYGIPAYRLPKDVLDREIDAVRSSGVDIVTNTPVSSGEALLAKGFDAVLGAAGAWRSLNMGIMGEDAPMVLDGLRFLQEVNSGRRKTIGGDVIVVGGGNTAVDAARAGLRMGAKTVLLYRRSREDMPALPEEVTDAEEEGVQIKFMTAPVRIEKNSVVCIKMAPGAVDESGRKKPLPVDGSEFSLPCDTVILAVGQTADAAVLRLVDNTDGTAKVDAKLRTPVKGLFAAGDAVTGPKTIIDAIAQGRLASIFMDRYLGGKGDIDPQSPPERALEHPQPKPMAVPRRLSEKMPAVDRTRGFDLVESGFDKATAIRESERCLACDIHHYRVQLNPDLCKGCGYCMEMCGMNVFSTSNAFNAGGYKPLVVENTDRCAGCFKCVYVCPDLAISLQEA
jgi:NADPH-dependent glutamate synthase beta subunit-like oxidoreductase